MFVWVHAYVSLRLCLCFSAFKPMLKKKEMQILRQRIVLFTKCYYLCEEKTEQT